MISEVLSFLFFNQYTSYSIINVIFVALSLSLCILLSNYVFWLLEFEKSTLKSEKIKGKELLDLISSTFPTLSKRYVNCMTNLAMRIESLNVLHYPQGIVLKAILQEFTLNQ